jgi:hypothetical protein
VNERDARSVLIVRAFEENDPKGEIFPHMIRSDATMRADAPLKADTDARESGDPTEEEEAFLIRRARLLREEFARGFPSAAHVFERGSWSPGIVPAIAGVAFVIGMLSNHLGPDRRVNIIAFPLVGMIAWNLAVYLLLVIEGIRGLKRGREPVADRGALAGRVARFIGKHRSRLDERELFSAKGTAPALKQFLQSWIVHTQRSRAAHARMALHIGAAALAIGAVAGMYLRGLALEYNAAWESTFLDAKSVHILVSTLLSPASWITGIPIPDRISIESLRANGAALGGNAAPWIHLHAATAAWTIILPRLILAGMEYLRRQRFRSGIHPIRREDPYFRRLFSPARGDSKRVSVLSYGLNLKIQARERLKQWLMDLFGWKAMIAFGNPILYGDEDQFVDALAADATDLCWVILFSMASTPEEENHGKVLERLKFLVADPKAERQLLVLVEQSGYRRRFTAESGFQQRMEERTKLWERFVENHGLTACVIDLEEASLDTETLRAHIWPASPIETKAP